VISNKLPSACRNIYTAGCNTARKHTHAECTTPVRDTHYSMYNCMYHRPLDSAFDAHSDHLRYNLAFSHQACDSRLITLYNNTSFSAYMQKGTPGCTRTFPTYIAFSPTSARPLQCIQPLYQACISIAFSTSLTLVSAALHNRLCRGAHAHIRAQPLTFALSRPALTTLRR
jgi:hypothetical protein